MDSSREPLETDSSTKDESLLTTVLGHDNEWQQQQHEPLEQPQHDLNEEADMGNPPERKENDTESSTLEEPFGGELSVPDGTNIVSSSFSTIPANTKETEPKMLEQEQEEEMEEGEVPENSNDETSQEQKAKEEEEDLERASDHDDDEEEEEEDEEEEEGEIRDDNRPPPVVHRHEAETVNDVVENHEVATHSYQLKQDSLPLETTSSSSYQEETTVVQPQESKSLESSDRVLDDAKHISTVATDIDHNKPNNNIKMDVEDVEKKIEEPDCEGVIDTTEEPTEERAVTINKASEVSTNQLPPEEDHAYATRGRQEDEAPPSPPIIRESFLSDSLTEEERRTRTRYLPQVTGMHALRKHEIKGDLALARTLQPMAGTATSTGSSNNKSSRKKNEDNEEDMPAASDDERLSDIVRLTGTKTVHLGGIPLGVPSAVFIPPEITDKKASSPRLVEAITAFNPPRPPESIGAKKKHRLLRWERRPADMETDLGNYRKTVARTHQELKNALAEQERLQTTENVLRTHWLQHIHAMSQEMIVLNETLKTVQAECCESAEVVLTQRTRSRGTGRGTLTAMREVLAVLKRRGQEMPPDAFQQPPQTTAIPVRGVGGVSAVSFRDCDRLATIQPPLGMDNTNWIVPGDMVETPGGEEGTVVSVIVPNQFDPSKASVDDSMDVDGAGGQNGIDEKKSIHFPTASVKLKSGRIQDFLVTELMTTEDPATFSDERLSLRWKGLLETAKYVAPVLDVEVMATVSDDNEEVDADVGSGGSAPGISRTNANSRILPICANLLPTRNGRGSSLMHDNLNDIDKDLHDALFNSGGIVGFRENPNPPANFTAVEILREEKLTLQARVLQLRNKVNRQRRIRLLNERTLQATQERSTRIQMLVAEMRADLASLKARLQEELGELGVTEDQASHILSNYFKSLENTHASPAKRPRVEDATAASDDDGEMNEQDEVMETEVPVGAK